MDQDLPPVVAAAQREQERWTRTRLLPVLVYVLGASLVGVPASMTWLGGNELAKFGVLAVWAAGMVAALGAIVTGAPEQRRRQKVIEEWHRREIARDIAGRPTEAAADPMDALVERMVALVDGDDRKAVIECRDRARALRADAARARAAGVALPSGGEGARSLADAADRAEAEAAALDDRLAALYADLVAPPADRSGVERVEARQEVERAAQAARRRLTE
jgi:hypothetical protein